MERFSPGELAVMAVFEEEVRRHGRCSLTGDATAKRAGVSSSTVRHALRRAKKLGLIVTTYGVEVSLGAPLPWCRAGDLIRSELAVLDVIEEEIRNGSCALQIGILAKRANVSTSTVITTLRKAKKLGLFHTKKCLTVRLSAK